MEDDGNIYESSAYPEYDLLGNQIRVATENPNLHYGDPSPGLRFIASLGERVYQERYFDANGLERVHYNNYTGNSQTFGGVNVSYTLVNEMLGG